MNVLVKCVAGSHLFGTNTPKSDKDFKGVYLPTLENCISGEVKHSIHHSTNTKVGTKNDQSDIDTEFYSIQKFFKMLEEGQTVALELLFTPDEFIIESSPMWEFIKSKRNVLVHRNIKAFIGYARQQADKYGLLGSKMNEIDTMITILDRFVDRSTLKTNQDEIKYLMPTNHCSFKTTINKGIESEYLVINGKMFDTRSTVIDVKTRLIDMSQAYGDRARQAANNENIDWKAVSHAIRVCYQGIELLETGKITLPLKNSEIIKSVKNGDLTFSESNDIIIKLFEELNTKYLTSSLPEKIDTRSILFEIYGNVYNL